MPQGPNVSGTRRALWVLPYRQTPGFSLAPPCCMISTICTTLSMCFRAAISPCSISIL